MTARWDQIPLGPTLGGPQETRAVRSGGRKVRIWVPNTLQETIGARLAVERATDPSLSYSALLQRALEAYFCPPGAGS